MINVLAKSRNAQISDVKTAKILFEFLINPEKLIKLFFNDRCYVIRLSALYTCFIIYNMHHTIHGRAATGH